MTRCSVIRSGAVEVLGREQYGPSHPAGDGARRRGDFFGELPCSTAGRAPRRSWSSRTWKPCASTARPRSLPPRHPRPPSTCSRPWAGGCGSRPSCCATPPPATSTKRSRTGAPRCRRSPTGSPSSAAASPSCFIHVVLFAGLDRPQPGAGAAAIRVLRSVPVRPADDGGLAGGHLPVGVRAAQPEPPGAPRTASAATSSTT